MLDTQEDIEQFILLSSKTQEEINEISKALSVSDATVSGILKVSIKQIPRFVLKTPFTIALRTSGADIVIKGRLKVIREQIFNSVDTIKLPTKTGSFKCKSIPAEQQDIDTLVKNQLFISGTIQNKIMLSLLEKNCGMKASFVVKPDDRGNSWVMLHVEPEE